MFTLLTQLWLTSTLKVTQRNWLLSADHLEQDKDGVVPGPARGHVDAPELHCSPHWPALLLARLSCQSTQRAGQGSESTFRRGSPRSAGSISCAGLHPPANGRSITGRSKVKQGVCIKLASPAAQTPDTQTIPMEVSNLYLSLGFTSSVTSLQRVQMPGQAARRRMASPAAEEAGIATATGAKTEEAPDVHVTFLTYPTFKQVGKTHLAPTLTGRRQTQESLPTVGK